MNIWVLQCSCCLSYTILLMQHGGVICSKLPTMPPELYYGSDGLMYGNDMGNYFIGDPATENGYICGTSAIVAAANTYLSSEGSSFYADDVSGSSPERLYQYVSEGTPVVVWSNLRSASNISEHLSTH